MKRLYGRVKQYFNKSVISLFILFMFFAFILAGTTIASYNIFFSDNSLELPLKNLVKKNKERQTVANSNIADLNIFVSSANDSVIFQKFLADKTKILDVQNLFLTLLDAYKGLREISYIDKNGIETIKVIKEKAKDPNKKAKIFPSSKLVSKENGYYFTTSKNKPLDKVWFSAIKPRVIDGNNSSDPRIEAVLPVSYKGKFDGVILMSFCINKFLKNLLHMPLYDVMLADKNGYFISHFEKSKNWSQYGDKNSTVYTQFPKYAQDILTKNHFNIENFASQNLEVPIKDDLILILKLKDKHVQKIHKDNKILYIVLFLISNIISFLFSLIIVKKFQKVLDNIKGKNNELYRRLHYDSLTKLKNRRSLINDTSKNRSCHLLLMDIQSFSTINDLYGVKVGDILLCNFAKFLQKCSEGCSREAYRVYGNTFAFVTFEDINENECSIRVNKLLQNLENHDFSFKYNDITLDFVVNIKSGIAFTKDGNNVLENADMALNYAKQTNKDFVIYNVDLGIEKLYGKDIQIIKAIKEALHEDRIVPYFQPIYKKDKVSYESLIRMKLKDGSVITPYHFLEASKKTRLYFALTKRMIKKTFETFENLPYDVSINLSYLDIKNPEILQYIKVMCDKYNIADRLIIEVIESDTFKDYENVIEFLTTLRSLGVKIAVDDFGSGYSNFSHLLKLKPYFLKIDGSLIKNIDIDESSFSVVKTIVNFAKDMNMKVIAEYIHSNEVYEKAKTLGFDGYQGFLLGTPKDAKDSFN